MGLEGQHLFISLQIRAQIYLERLDLSANGFRHPIIEINVEEPGTVLDEWEEFQELNLKACVDECSEHYIQFKVSVHQVSARIRNI